jgi:hypothetical protein
MSGATAGDPFAGRVPQLADVAVTSVGDQVEYRRSSRLFAAGGDGTVELRLGEEIAEAALRTPDTHASSRGDDWVRLAPREWDKHAIDRLAAWFLVAWRAAGKP